jgi:hypothetical protein
LVHVDRCGTSEIADAIRSTGRTRHRAALVGGIVTVIVYPALALSVLHKEKQDVPE